jgi:hypothetical protein
VGPPAGIEPATPSLPWNHREPLCGPPFPQLAPDRKGQSYRFSFDEVMRSPNSLSTSTDAQVIPCDTTDPRGFLTPFERYYPT